MEHKAQISENPRFNLNGVSVVVIAQCHNPSILNPDFLVAHKIVPEDWQVSETFTTPPLSVVKYQNGIIWQVDQSRMSVVESSGPAFVDKYRVHQLAAAYLKALPFVPYQSLGLNCKVSTHQPSAQRWLINRLGASWLSKETSVLGITPRLHLRASNNAVCHISFVGTPQNSEQIVVDCNFHHEGPLDAEGLYTAIGRWPDYQAFVVSALTKLFRN
jgi:hypothetical protein